MAVARRVRAAPQLGRSLARLRDGRNGACAELNGAASATQSRSRVPHASRGRALSRHVACGHVPGCGATRHYSPATPNQPRPHVDVDEAVTKLSTTFLNHFPARLNQARLIGREAEYPVVRRSDGSAGSVAAVIEKLDESGDLRLKMHGDLGLYCDDYEYRCVRARACVLLVLAVGLVRCRGCACLVLLSGRAPALCTATFVPLVAECCMPCSVVPTCSHTP